MSYHPVTDYNAERERAESTDQQHNPLYEDDYSEEYGRKVGLNPSRPPREIKLRMVGVCAQIILCILLSANLALFGYRTVSFNAETRVVTGELQTAHTTMTYGSNPNFMSLDHKFDEYWDDEMSSFNGVIRTNPDDIDAEPQWGAIGMFHQLHCLAGIRMALQRSREGEDIGIDINDDKHWPHCLWYMHQAILCAADSTIEMGQDWGSEVQPNGTVTAIRTGAISGKYDVRVCQDSDRLYRLRAEVGKEAGEARVKRIKAQHNGGE